MSNKGTKAVIGTTRRWNAKESGIDLAEGLMEKLNENPDFIVLFSTIHYMKNGGFEHLLEGIYEVFPENVKLVGGTVNGFLNNDGCFARGATALAVSSDEMDVAIGIGHNTKRNPKKAALQCASDLKKNLSHSGFQNGFLLHIISGAEVPNIPPIGTKKIIKPGAAPNTLMKLFSLSQYRLQMGPSRDEEILEGMIGYMPDFSMLSGATLDDGHGIHNYQFYNRTVMKNAIVSLGLKTNKEIFVKSTTNLKRTDIEFDITKISKDKRIIHEINGRPALEELLRLLKWPQEILKEETWFHTTFYFPIGGQVSELSKNNDSAHVIGIVLGNSLLLTCKLIGSHASILTIDGKGLFDVIDKNMDYIDFTPSFGLISSCITRFETLGHKMYEVRDRIKTHVKDSPFVVFYVGGESTYSKNEGLSYSNISFNSMIV
ncbi:MAG: FIST N-terminal domain-containing protein [Candidatus Thermoplasmatota archaeon]|nr:FIST N-terminal domain-containing protein [Candidatus Thermoplasmatota archaeon]